MVDGVPDMPEPSNTYLLATRFNSAENWHTFLPGYGDTQIRDTTKAADLRLTFTEAVKKPDRLNPVTQCGEWR